MLGANELSASILEKLAINRWKKELQTGNVSQQGVERLQPIMPKPEKMIAGLNLGTENIANKHGLPLHETSFGETANQAGKALKGGLSGGFGALKDQLSAVPGQLAESVKKLSLKPLAPTVNAASRGFKSGAEPFLPELKQKGTTLGISLMGGGAATVPKNHLLFPPGIYTMKGQPLLRRMAKTKMNPTEKDYLSAVIKRHEADEGRVGAALGNPQQPWIPTYKNTIFGRHVQQGQGSHFGPQVLVNESRNLAMAPPAVREAMKKVRGMTGEAGLLAGHGVQYGDRTPLAGSAAERKAVKSIHSAALPPDVISAQGAFRFSPEAKNLFERLGPKLTRLLSRR